MGALCFFPRLAFATTLPSPDAPPSGASVFVAVDGDDAADGSAERPFATLSRAQAEMKAGKARTAIVRGGTYKMRARLSLRRDDSGASLVAAPGHAPILDGAALQPGPLIDINGASGVTVSGLGFASAASGSAALRLSDATDARIIGNRFVNGAGILLTGSSGNLVCANRIDDAAASGIEAKDGSNGNVFDSNVIDGARAIATYGAPLFLHGASRNAIVHNVIQDAAGAGIVLANWDSGTINVGNTIAHNIVRATNLMSVDSGAIYVLGRSHVDTKTEITHNLVDGTGAGDDAHTIGIYLDDSASGIRVEDNIVRDIGTHAVQIHGGDDIMIRNNVFDLGAGSASAVLFQSAPADTNPANTMRNNRVVGNLILSRGKATAAYAYIDGGRPEIARNFYDGPVGGTVARAGPTGDADAHFGNPSRPSAESQAALESLAAAAIGFRPVDTSRIGLHPDTPACHEAAQRLRATLGPHPD